MRVIRTIDNFPEAYRGGCATIGCFDGMHQGHRRLLQLAQECAEHHHRPVLVITFANHPANIIRGGRRIRLLTTLEEKLNLLQRYGADAVLLMTFNRDFSVQRAGDFCRDVLYHTLGLTSIVVGFNFHFGWQREGTADFLEEQGRQLGFSVVKVPPMKVEGQVVSSSLIRDLVTRGEVGEAARFLGRDFEITGRVIKGRFKGRELGFPTANLSPFHNDKIMPGAGVYAMLARWRNKWWPAAGYVGTRPSFDSGSVSLEVHLLGFNGDLYGEVLNVRFVERLRTDKRFQNVKELSMQIARDCEKAKEILGYVS